MTVGINMCMRIREHQRSRRVVASKDASAPKEASSLVRADASLLPVKAIPNGMRLRMLFGA